MNLLPIQSINPTQMLSSNSGVSVQGGSNSSFGSLLTDALNKVNSLATASEQQGLALSSGSATNISNVMISATQAQLAVDLTVQVRDRVIQAYNQVMNMQV